MTKLDSHRTLSEPVRSPVETGAAGEPILSSGELQENRIDWENVIDRQLVEWVRDAGRLEDESIEMPCRSVIAMACRVAQSMRDAGMPAPLRVVPSGDGGIVFEHREGSLFETIEIDSDGSVEIAVFLDSRLVSRRRLN